MSFRAGSGSFVSGCTHYAQPGDVEGQRGQCELNWRNAWFLFQDPKTSLTTALRRATKVLAATGDLSLVMRTLGHSNAQTAMIYQHPSMEDVRK